MKKIIRTISIIFVMTFIISGTAFADTDLQINAKSAVLMDAATGKILISHNPDEKLPPASVTKVMTLLLIYDAVNNGKISWEDSVSVSEHAASMGGSQVFLEPGEQQSVKELTKCIAIASANDAAVAMAEFIGGSEESFVALMNEKAIEIGMTNTTFKNACGLDADEHTTTAKDIAIMSRELIVKYPDVFKYTKTWQDSIIHKTKRGEEEFGLTNTNKLLKWYSGTTGLKTGSTGKALYCLSGTAEKNGMNLIGVVMAAPDYKTRFQEVMKMLDYGFANYSIKSCEPMGTKVATVKVFKGEQLEADVVIKDDVKVLVKKGFDAEITNKIEIESSISAPILAGTKVGEIIYYFDNEEAGKSDLIIDKDINKAGFKDNMQRLMDKWI